jgi:putative lipoic acid-binding regulatory protein
MNYKEQEFIAKRLEFILSHEHIKDSSKGDYRNMFSYVKRAALGRYLNLLIENNVLDEDDLEDAFLELSRTSISNSGFKETLTPDEQDKWYEDTALLFQNWVK